MEINLENIPNTIEKYYSEKEITSKIINIIQNNNKISEINNNEEFLLITEASCFYPRGGGQEGDKGIIFNDNCEIEVFNTTKKNKIIIHHCKLIKGTININETMTLKINEEWRNGTTIHHTATHIFCILLQGLFGKHITQKGSLIVSNKFRFDTNIERALTLDETNFIENKMKEIIEKSLPVNVKYIPLEELKKMSEEEVEIDPSINYENIVKTIEIKGIPLIPCGGTHVTNTSIIKNFKIIKEKSHGKGIRRFEVECNF